MRHSFLWNHLYNGFYTIYGLPLKIMKKVIILLYGVHFRDKFLLKFSLKKETCYTQSKEVNFYKYLVAPSTPFINYLTGRNFRGMNCEIHIFLSLNECISICICKLLKSFLSLWIAKLNSAKISSLKVCGPTTTKIEPLLTITSSNHCIDI